jgi:hypothetical protein
MPEAPDATATLDAGPVGGTGAATCPVPAAGPGAAVPGCAGFGPLALFLRRLVAHVAGQRCYLSYSERDAMVAIVAQFEPAYSRRRLGEDLAARNVDLVRLALGQVADIGGRTATLALVSTIQLALADHRLDDDDLNLVAWVGRSVGLDPEEVRRAVGVVAGRARPIAPAPLDAV